jgi:cell wall assembly regulator SMI1
MEQIKPKVIGYVQIGFFGDDFNSSYIIGKSEIKFSSKLDFTITGIKSKFRPVYE